jgi:hypothetical protein
MCFARKYVASCAGVIAGSGLSSLLTNRANCSTNAGSASSASICACGSAAARSAAFGALPVSDIESRVAQRTLAASSTGVSLWEVPELDHSAMAAAGTANPNRYLTRMKVPYSKGVANYSHLTVRGLS